MSRLNLIVFASIAIASASCSKKDEPFRKPTYPVTGKVTVDGVAPGTPVQVKCFSTGAADNEHPTFSQTETKADGSFEISTYESGDGVPVGDYVLTFIWQDFSLLSREYSGPDRLKNKYGDPKKSEFTVTVKESDKPTDLGLFQLSTD